MKPIPAIVEQAIDLDLIREQITIARAEMHQAESSAERHDKASADARIVAQQRRIDIGRALIRARGAWPERGPNAKGWGEYLRSMTLAESTAKEWMEEARDPEGFAGRRSNPAKTSDQDDDQPDTVIGPRGREPAPPPFRQLTKQELIQAIARLPVADRNEVIKASKPNVAGGSGEVERGKWRTDKKWATAVGDWDHDPFSNPQSLILSVTRCMLEDGGDGFGGGKPGETPGLYLVGARPGMSPTSGVADAGTRVWIQPPYEIVLDAIAHYGHTRFCALLRLSPDVKWFRRLWPLVSVIAIPMERLDFDPPPGIPKPDSSIPYPHALYYADESDVTDAVRSLCIVMRIDHERSDPRELQQTFDYIAAASSSQLHIVR